MPAGLAALVARAGSGRRAPPVERWDPPDCGAIDMAIDFDGGWSYMGSPIGRPALVRLFASVLRREPDGRHVLVTPVEKVTIRVADAPFVAVEMHAEREGMAQRLTFRTNVGDVVAAGPDHPLRFVLKPGRGDLMPYLHVRGGLEARLARPLLYELVERASELAGRAGVFSGGRFFPFPEAEDAGAAGSEPRQG
jgi:hypothetical protein